MQIGSAGISVSLRVWVILALQGHITLKEFSVSVSPGVPQMTSIVPAAALATPIACIDLSGSSASRSAAAATRTTVEPLNGPALVIIVSGTDFDFLLLVITEGLLEPR